MSYSSWGHKELGMAELFTHKHIHKKGSTCQQMHEKMLHITNHPGNENKTTMRYHLTPVRIAIIKKITSNLCGEDVVEKESLCPVDGIVKQ